MRIVRSMFSAICIIWISLSVSYSQESAPMGQPIVPQKNNYNKNIKWRAFQGVNKGEKANKIVADAAGNIVVISCPEPNPYIAKIDGRTGGLVWENHMTSLEGMFLGLTEIKAKERIDYIVSGGIGSTRERWVARLNGDTGKVVWQQTYKYPGNRHQFDTVRNVSVGSDGFIYGSGHVQGDEKDSFFVVYAGQAFLMKIDPEKGNEIWTSLNSNAMFAVAHQEASDGCVYYVADTFEENLSFGKVDRSDGRMVSTTTLSDTKHIIPSDFAVGPGGSFYLGGHAGRNGAGDPFDYTCTKITEDGSVTWTKRYANPRGYSLNYIRNELYGVKVGSDGVYLFGGSGDEDPVYSEEHPPFPSSDIWVGWVVKTGFDGDIVRSDVYYHDEGEGGSTATEYGDLIPGGYVICNDTDANWEVGETDIGVMKIVHGHDE